MVMTVQGSITLINTVIDFPELIPAFIPDLHICKFQEYPIKTEGLMVMKGQKQAFSAVKIVWHCQFSKYRSC